MTSFFVVCCYVVSTHPPYQFVNYCHPHRSTQTSASVGADIRICRRRHAHRSTQTCASVGADIRIGRRRCYFVMFYKSFSSTSR